jgi:hypothetical protein
MEQPLDTQGHPDLEINASVRFPGLDTKFGVGGFDSLRNYGITEPVKAFQSGKIVLFPRPRVLYLTFPNSHTTVGHFESERITVLR